MPEIHRNNGVAVWAQIAAALREDISRNTSGEMWLPSEPEMAASFGVNRHTLRRAVDTLIAEGLVERVHGRGTRILARELIYEIGRDTRFTERLAASGRSASVVLLQAEEVAAVGGVARNLHLPEGTKVWHLRTLRGDGSLPYALTSHYLTGPASEAARSYTGGSLTQHLREVADMGLDRIESLISTRLPLLADALLLRMPRNQPVLRVKGINACRTTGQRLEYAISQFRGDCIQLLVTTPGD